MTDRLEEDLRNIANGCRIARLEQAICNIIAGCRKSNCYRVIKKKRIDDYYIGEDLILAARDALEGKHEKHDRAN